MKALGARFYYLETGTDGRVRGCDQAAVPGARLSYIGGIGIRFGLCVWEHPEGISLTSPVRVFRVTDIDQIGVGGVTRSPGVVHVCRALTVVDEIPEWRIFGVNGETIARLVEQAEAIDEDALGRFPTSTAGMEAALRTTHGETFRLGGPSSAMAIVAAVVYAAAKRSPRPVFEIQEVFDPEFGPFGTRNVLVDPRWKAAVLVAQCAVLGFAARAAIDDERFQVLTSTWVTAMGDPSTHDADPAAAAME
jgi:hypothetical protein